MLKISKTYHHRYDLMIHLNETLKVQLEIQSHSLLNPHEYQYNYTDYKAIDNYIYKNIYTNLKKKSNFLHF